ncbi:hypothetical protein BESB_059070 [Besnoitia besnoiti]|uniref:Cupin type-1 domain-containing protein n=1 Tax=Besnoitia besnoiti TaxID=94643 RepID=A0A2A9MHZ3_BESBE|nr:hypothetical protein BESB_059070 [Besnoitia besnoiti]PFH35020.1 hypothetical protein BESB_059070 [Besnoitia besnoiti]
MENPHTPAALARAPSEASASDESRRAGAERKSREERPRGGVECTADAPVGVRGAEARGGHSPSPPGREGGALTREGGRNDSPSGGDEHVFAAENGEDAASRAEAENDGSRSGSGRRQLEPGELLAAQQKAARQGEGAPCAERDRGPSLGDDATHLATEKVGGFPSAPPLSASASSSDDSVSRCLAISAPVFPAGDEEPLRATASPRDLFPSPSAPAFPEADFLPPSPPVSFASTSATDAPPFSPSRLDSVRTPRAPASGGTSEAAAGAQSGGRRALREGEVPLFPGSTAAAARCSPAAAHAGSLESDGAAFPPTDTDLFASPAAQRGAGSAEEAERHSARFAFPAAASGARGERCVVLAAQTQRDAQTCRDPAAEGASEERPSARRGGALRWDGADNVFACFPSEGAVRAESASVRRRQEEGISAGPVDPEAFGVAPPGSSRRGSDACSFMSSALAPAASACGSSAKRVGFRAGSWQPAADVQRGATRSRSFLPSVATAQEGRRRDARAFPPAQPQGPDAAPEGESAAAAQPLRWMFVLSAAEWSAKMPPSLALSRWQAPRLLSPAADPLAGGSAGHSRGNRRGGTGAEGDAGDARRGPSRVGVDPECRHNEGAASSARLLCSEAAAEGSPKLADAKEDDGVAASLPASLPPPAGVERAHTNLPRSHSAPIARDGAAPSCLEAAGGLASDAPTELDGRKRETLPPSFSFPCVSPRSAAAEQAPLGAPSAVPSASALFSSVPLFSAAALSSSVQVIAAPAAAASPPWRMHLSTAVFMFALQGSGVLQVTQGDAETDFPFGPLAALSVPPLTPYRVLASDAPLVLLVCQAPSPAAYAEPAARPRGPCGAR